VHVELKVVERRVDSLYRARRYLVGNGHEHALMLDCSFSGV
jgi:hypothetical protein